MRMTATTWESSGVVTVNSSPGRFSFHMVQSLLRLAGWVCVMALGRKTVLSDFFWPSDMSVMEVLGIDCEGCWLWLARRGIG
jgi:hypothetical protein